MEHNQPSEPTFEDECPSDQTLQIPPSPNVESGYGGTRSILGSQILAEHTTPLDSGDHEVNPRINHAFDRRESLLSSRISIFVKAAKPKIPDGGWGWLVVLACLIINLVSDGVCNTFGILYIEFLQEFKASQSATSWIGSLFMAVPLLAGPIMSALVDKYGCRSMTIIGALVSTLGFVISSYVRTIGAMYLTFGVIGGIGLGLCFVTAVVSIAFWFDKNRALALGLGACGTGIGTFAYAPLTTYLNREYGWRGALLIISGTFLNLCVCGALMRDPDWVIKQNRLNSKTSKASLQSIDKLHNSTADMEEIKTLLKEGRNASHLLPRYITPMDTIEEKREEFSSVVNLPTYIKQNETVTDEVLEQLISNKKLYHIVLENYPSMLINKSSSYNELNKLPDENIYRSKKTPPVTIKIKKTEKPHHLVQQISFEDTIEKPIKKEPEVVNKVSNNPPIRNNSFTWLKKQFEPHNYLKNMRFRTNSFMHKGAMLNIKKYRIRASSCPNIYKNSMTTLKEENEETWYWEFLELIKGMTHFSLFLDIHFLLLSLSTALLFTWFIVPYFYLVEHMTTFGGYTVQDASLIISVIGITNTIGMIVLGWAGDRPWMNVAKVYSICLILCGLSCAAMYFFTATYYLVVCMGALFGLFFASSFSLIPALLAEMVSLEKFTVAYGLILLCQGIGNLLGPPLAGLIYDLTHSLEQPFYQAGLWILVAGVLIGIIPFVPNVKITRKFSK